MSYEPRLIVEQKDLKAKEEYIDNLKDDELRDYLLVVLRKEPSDFKGRKLLLFTPELSSFNEKVRKFLNKHDIEYGLDN
jgi:hypothetical protein